MKQRPKLRTIATTLCCFVAMLFFFFFIYLFFFENISVYSSRHAHTYDTLKHFSVEQIEDDTAPIGIRTAYHILLDNFDSSESCMCFYIVHHYADVYLDGELIHQLGPDAHNKIGSTISSNWVTVPIHEEDSNKELTVILTPLFKEVIDFEPEFLAGSHFSIVLDQFRDDISQLFLALMCIILGIFILITQLYFMRTTNLKKWNMFYLAIFAFLLGICRLSDTKSSPIIFSQNPMVLGYITIGSLFLCSLFLQLYISSFFSKKRAQQLLFVNLTSCALVFGVWFMQIMGLAEFKTMLPISHILLIVTIGSAFLFSLLSKREGTKPQPGSPGNLFLILALGICIDLILFYLHSSSSNIIFSVLAFVIYTVIVFVRSILDTTKKAQLDSPTGLINKSRWNELMQGMNLDEEIICIAMIDLNGLKHINDTYGHEAGDKMIYEFSSILKSSFPSNSIICRWGGDEFVIVLENKLALNIEQYVLSLHNKIDAYNTTVQDLKLSYAAGYCLSTEQPGSDYMELLKIADSRMYSNKKDCVS